jgi:transcription elongation factor Elf1
MNIKPTDGGGRTMFGDAAFGRYDIKLHAAAHGKTLCIVDANGLKVGTMTIDFATPEHPMPSLAPKQQVMRERCKHRSEKPTRRFECDSCPGKTFISVFACDRFYECCIKKTVEGVSASCATCIDYAPMVEDKQTAAT